MTAALHEIKKSSYGQSGVSCGSYRSDYGSGRIGVTIL